MSETFFQISTWIVTAVALTGMVLNAKMNRWGFACWWFTNTAWIVVGIYKGVYAQAVQHVVYLYFSVVGFLHWTQRLRDQRAALESSSGSSKQRVSSTSDSGDADRPDVAEGR